MMYLRHTTINTQRIETRVPASLREYSASCWHFGGAHINVLSA